MESDSPLTSKERSELEKYKKNLHSNDFQFYRFFLKENVLSHEFMFFYFRFSSCI